MAGRARLDFGSNSPAFARWRFATRRWRRRFDHLNKNKNTIIRKFLNKNNEEQDMTIKPGILSTTKQGREPKQLWIDIEFFFFLSFFLPEQCSWNVPKTTSGQTKLLSIFLHVIYLLLLFCFVSFFLQFIPLWWQLTKGRRSGRGAGGPVAEALDPSYAEEVKMCSIGCAVASLSAWAFSDTAPLPSSVTPAAVVAVDAVALPPRTKAAQLNRRVHPTTPGPNL